MTGALATVFLSGLKEWITLTPDSQSSAPLAHDEHCEPRPACALLFRFPFLVPCVTVCVHMCGYMCVGCTHTFVYLCRETWGQLQMFLRCCPLCFLETCVLWAWNMPSRLNGLASKPRGLACLGSSDHTTIQDCFLLWLSVDKLKFPCLQGDWLTDWNISLAP